MCVCVCVCVCVSLCVLGAAAWREKMVGVSISQFTFPVTDLIRSLTN